MDNPPNLELKNFLTTFLPEKGRFIKEIFLFTSLLVFDNLQT